MSSTPQDRQVQRGKRGLSPSSTPAKQRLPSPLLTPGAKKAKLLNKQTSVGQISNSAKAGSRSSRPSPGSKLPMKASLTPSKSRTCQRNLKKSSSYCIRNKTQEDKKRVESNAHSDRNNKISRSANRKTPIDCESSNSDEARCTLREKLVSQNSKRYVKILFDGKIKRHIDGDDDDHLRPSKRISSHNLDDELGVDNNEANPDSNSKKAHPCNLLINCTSESDTNSSSTQYSFGIIQNDAVSPFCRSSLKKNVDPNSFNGSPHKKLEHPRSLHKDLDKKSLQSAQWKCDGVFSVHVAVRVRPFSKREKESRDVQCVVEMYENSTCVTETNGTTHHFTYDMSYWSFDDKDPTFCDQEDVYKASAQPLLDGVLAGYNTCLFAYGQTGSGKSYSMIGYAETGPGIIPRFCEELFERTGDYSNVEFTVEISFFEIYNEKIHDLLSYSQECKKQLKVREHPEQGPYVQDLSLFTVRCYKDIEVWLAVGNRNRATAATGMNDKSSRSHSVFTISLQQKQGEFLDGSATQLCRRSKVSLIDLAGSEKAKNVSSNEANMNPEAANSRLKEGSCINKSLHTLGKVISLLSEQQTGSKKKIFVPYRDSVLTWLLRESLGGNSRTAMIATISPASTHLAETLSTLRYARQARNIVNQARVNEDSNSKMIRELLSEIDRLKSTQNVSREESSVSSTEEIEMLRSKLKETKEQLAESTRMWQDKVQVSEKKQKQEKDKLRRSGVAFKVDNTLPNLVNLNEDPMLSEVLVYVLREGKTTVGNSQSDENHDVKLTGPLVADFHCYVTYGLKQVRITPIGDALTFVNGEQVIANHLLKHGDRIVIGGTHFFGFNHHQSVHKSAKREGRKKWDGLTMKDFEFAKKELATQQNAKLEAELDDLQVKAQEDVIELITNAKVFEETKSSQREIILELEREKQRIEENVLRLKTKKVQREVVRNEIRTVLSSVDERGTDKKRDLLKIALLLREANKISQKLGRFITFSRDDVLEDDKVEIRVRLNDTKYGKTTLWSLDKLELMIGKMRELYQANGLVEDETEDPFDDPDDEWVDDFVLDSPTSNTSGLRLSISRRHSLNHSLNLLTNLNSSLSELSSRRQSSLLNTSQGLMTIEETSDNSSLAILRDVLEETPPTNNGISVCVHLMMIASQIVAEYHHHEKRMNLKSKSLYKVAILLQRFREAFSTWHVLQRKYKYEFLQKTLENVADKLDKSFTDFKALVKTASEDCSRLNCNINVLIGKLQEAVKLLGELSLCAADLYQEPDGLLFECGKRSTLTCLFMEGQLSFWDSFIQSKVDDINDLKRDVEILQLKSIAKLDLEKHLRMLNSFASFLQRTHEFMVGWHSVTQDLPTVGLCERYVLNQRRIVGILTKFTFNLKKLSNATQNISTDDAIFSDGIFQSLSDDTETLLNEAAKMLKHVKAVIQDSLVESPGNVLEQVDEAFGRLEFSARRLRVSMGISPCQNSKILQIAKQDSFLSYSEGNVNVTTQDAYFCPLAVI